MTKFIQTVEGGYIASDAIAVIEPYDDTDPDNIKSRARLKGESTWIVLPGTAEENVWFILRGELV